MNEETESLRDAEMAIHLDAPPDWMHHSLAVAARYRTLVQKCGLDLSVAPDAGLMHDVGRLYPNTGHVGIDGARWLRANGFPKQTCLLVAWHSTAEAEAKRSGVANTLLHPDRDLAAALLVADFTTSVTGEPCTLQERIDEIASRYAVTDASWRLLDETGRLIYDSFQFVRWHTGDKLAQTTGTELIRV